MGLFSRKVKTQEITRERIEGYYLRVVAGNDLDLAIVREVAFLEDAQVLCPMETRPIGQRKEETAIIPIFGEVPLVPGAGSVVLRPEVKDPLVVFERIKEAVHLNLRWGAPYKVIRFEIQDDYRYWNLRRTEHVAI